MSKINSFKINTATMPSIEVTRSFTVSGEADARFMIIALQDGTIKYYNFVDQVFENGNTFNSNLIVTLGQTTYTNSIVFPSGAGDYVLKLIPFEGNELRGNKKVFTRNISKLSSTAEVTFQAATTNTANYATFPTSTSTGEINDSGTVNFNWDIQNASTDAGGFGLRFTTPTVIPEISGSNWYFTTTEAVADNPAGDGEDSATVTVADVTDLGVGTELYYHKATTVPTNKAGSAVGTTIISAIDTETKTITFNKDVAFEDGETMTFRAYGAEAISAAIDMSLTFLLYPTVTPTLLTTTVRANVSSSTTITLTDTLGISGGNIIKWTGVGVDNGSGNFITSVTPDPGGGDGDGSMVVQLAQTLSAGTLLRFKNIYKTINFNGHVVITKYPAANRTIYLDLDKLITVGTAS